MVISKNQVIKIIDICILRRQNNLNCMNCKYKGKQCIDAHVYAGIASRVMLQRDVRKEMKNEQRKRSMDNGETGKADK